MDKKLVAKEILKVARLISALHAPKYGVDNIVRWAGNRKSFYKIVKVNQYNPEQIPTYDIENMTTHKTATGVSEHDLFKEGDVILDKQGRSPEMAAKDDWLGKDVVLREYRFEEVGKVSAVKPNGSLTVEIFELEAFHENDHGGIHQEEKKLSESRKVKETAALKPYLFQGEWRWGTGALHITGLYKHGQKVIWQND